MKLFSERRGFGLITVMIIAAIIIGVIAFSFVSVNRQIRVRNISYAYDQTLKVADSIANECVVKLNNGEDLSSLDTGDTFKDFETEFGEALPDKYDCKYKLNVDPDDPSTAIIGVKLYSGPKEVARKLIKVKFVGSGGGGGTTVNYAYLQYALFTEDKLTLQYLSSIIGAIDLKDYNGYWSWTPVFWSEDDPDTDGDLYGGNGIDIKYSSPIINGDLVHPQGTNVNVNYSSAIIRRGNPPDYTVISDPIVLPDYDEEVIRTVIRSALYPRDPNNPTHPYIINGDVVISHNNFDIEIGPDGWVNYDGTPIYPADPVTNLPPVLINGDFKIQNSNTTIRFRAPSSWGEGKPIFLFITGDFDASTSNVVLDFGNNPAIVWVLGKTHFHNMTIMTSGSFVWVGGLTDQQLSIVQDELTRHDIPLDPDDPTSPPLIPVGYTPSLNFDDIDGQIEFDTSAAQFMMNYSGDLSNTYNAFISEKEADDAIYIHNIASYIDGVLYAPHGGIKLQYLSASIHGSIISKMPLTLSNLSSAIYFDRRLRNLPLPFANILPQPDDTTQGTAFQINRWMEDPEGVGSDFWEDNN